MQAIREVYSLLMPVAEGRVVIPRAAVAEVMGFSRPKNKPENSPDFMLGYVEWQGQPIPLVSFEAACGQKIPELSRRARVAVVFGIAGKLDPNVFALVTQGYPYLVRVNEGVLLQDELKDTDAGKPILARTRMANERPLIPDLEQLELMLADALGIVDKPVIEASLDELDSFDVGEDEGMEDALLDDGLVDMIEVADDSEIAVEGDEDTDDGSDDVSFGLDDLEIDESEISFEDVEFDSDETDDK